MTPRPVIIDTDPGQDDAMAILAALASPELEVLGITCVAGNVPLPQVVTNTRKVIELAGRTDVPIFAGCARPLVRDQVTAEHVHGSTGLDGPELPEPTVAVQPEHAVRWLVDTLLAAPDASVTLCPVGPLTNIAAAIVTEPAVLPKIREIVMMGGAYWEGGNITPVAEFNIYVDPHAAHAVFSSGVPLVVMPLDVTHKALMSEAWLASLEAMGTPVGTASAEMLRFFERFDEAKYGTDGGPLHDPNTIAYLCRPDLYTGREVNVMIETASELSMGQTVVDWWRVTRRPPNCTWIHDVDAAGFYAYLSECLASY